MSGMGQGVGCFTSPASIGSRRQWPSRVFTHVQVHQGQPTTRKPETKKAKHTRVRHIYSKECMVGVGACVGIRLGWLVCTRTLHGSAEYMTNSTSQVSTNQRLNAQRTKLKVKVFFIKHTSDTEYKVNTPYNLRMVIYSLLIR